MPSLRSFLVILVSGLVTFSSVFALSEFFPHAQTLANAGVINTQSSEYGYRLSSTISRAEAVKLALGSAGVVQRDCRGLSVFSFVDVSSSLGSLCGYVESAVEKGIVTPYVTNVGKYFFPNAPITRGDFADIIVRSFDVTSPELIGTPSEGTRYYTDVVNTLVVAKSVNRLATTGCLNLNITTFRPSSTITRGEAFKMMACLVQKKKGGANTEGMNQEQGTNMSGSGNQDNTNSSNNANTQQQATNSQSASSSYAWVTSSYGACSKSCGEGVQTRGVVCKNTLTNAVTFDGNCIATGVKKPVTQQLCNVLACEGSIGTGITPGSSPTTQTGISTTATSVPGFPWIIGGVSYSSLAEVRTVYKSPCIKINGIYAAVGFGPCVSGTSTNITTITGATNTSSSNPISTNQSPSLSGQALIDALCTKYPAQGLITCKSATSAVVTAPPQTKCDTPIVGMHSAGVWEAKSATQVLIMAYWNVPEYYELDNIRGMVGASPFTRWSEGGTAIFSDCAGTSQGVAQACRMVIFNDSPLAIYAPKECVLDASRKYYLNHTYGGPQFKVTEATVKYEGSSWKKKATKNTSVTLTCPQNISTGMLCLSSYESCNSGSDQYECSPGGVTNTSSTVTSTTASTTNPAMSATSVSKVTAGPATKCDTPIEGMHSAGFWRPGSAGQVLIMAYWNVPEYYELDNTNLKEITQNYSFNIFSDGGSPSFSDCPGTRQNLLCGTRGYVFDDSPYAKYAPKECVLDSNRKYYLNHTYSGPQVKFNPNMPNSNYVWKRRTQANPALKLTCPDGIYDGYNCNYYTQTCNSGTDQYICQPQSSTTVL